MARLVFCGTYGFDNPNRATLPLYLAEGAIEAGHDVTLVFMNDAPTLLRREVAEKLAAHGFPPFLEMLENFTGKILVCTGCANSRGFYESDMDIDFAEYDEARVQFVSRIDIANTIADAHQVLTF